MNLLVAPRSCVSCVASSAVRQGVTFVQVLDSREHFLLDKLVVLGGFRDRNGSG
jgi:hypothetical protein